MQNAITTIGFDKCTGCYGCQNICGFDAIKMPLDKDGFYKPVIDETKCIECGACDKICPVINYTNPNTGEPEAYAGWSNDDVIRLSSSSGGLFSEIATNVINRGGVVFGVKWQNGLVEYSWTETIEGLAEFRGSKYLQANVGLAYKEVRKFIKSGREVLFAGVPCQVATLRNIVKSDKLILIDLACLGTPSIKVYKKYLKEKFVNQDITQTNFRSKSTGWRSFSIEFWSSGKLVESTLHNKNKLFYGFSPKVLYTNTACYNCKFNVIPRCGDLTLADYWGAPSGIDSSKGVSAMLINNTRGKKIADNLNIYFVQQPLEQILRGTPRLNRAIHVPMPEDRSSFFQNIDNKSFDELSSIYLKCPNKIVWFLHRIVLKIKKMISV